MKKNLKLFVLTLLVALSAISELSAKDFPRAPELSVTPGKLCEYQKKFRYPEQIAYCFRDVSYELKEIIILEYDQKFDYNIRKFPRTDFKIDHFIPLCMGGSNDITNLWPQHRSIYEVTDPIEPFLCDLMEQGILKQTEAVSYIKRAKANPTEVVKIIQELSR